MNTIYVKLPYVKKKLNDSYLLTNECGEYIFLSEEEMILYESDRYKDISNFYKLTSRFFLCEEDEKDWTEHHIQQKSLLKKSFIYETELLLMVVPSLACNCSCIYCQVNSVNSDDFSMDFKTIKQFCGFVSRLPHKRIKIEFQGGEPTLQISSMELIVKVLSKIDTIEITYVICSNLLCIDSDFIKFIKRYNINISTSIDGGKTIHDFQRPSRCVSSSFNETVKNIKRLREFDVYPSALMTITHDSLPLIFDTIDTYLKLGFQSVFIRPLNLFGRAYQNDNLHIGDSEFVESYTAVLKYLLKLSLEDVVIKDEYTAILLRKIITPFEDGFTDLQDPCAYGTMSLLVNYDGLVYPCDEARMLSEMGDRRWIIGSIFDEDILLKIANFKTYAWSIRLDNIPSCKSCVYKHYCGADPIRLSQRGESNFCGIREGIFDAVFTLISLDDNNILKIFNKWARE